MNTTSSKHVSVSLKYFPSEFLNIQCIQINGIAYRIISRLQLFLPDVCNFVLSWSPPMRRPMGNRKSGHTRRVVAGEGEQSLKKSYSRYII